MSIRNTTMLLAKGAVMLMASGCSVLTPSGGKSVLYEVTSTSGTATDVTYEIGNGTQQETHVALPWSKTFTTGGGIQPLVVTAQNPGAGVISCQISVDGTVVSEHTSSGQYAVVVCSATSR
jgi:hypothetical protein